MRKVLLLINSYDRLFTLKLVLRYLELQDIYDMDILIMDQGSRDVELLKYYDSCPVEVYKFNVVHRNIAGNFKCGEARYRSLYYWIHHKTKYDFCFMMDDDILIDVNTIRYCLDFYDTICHDYKISAVTPYSVVKSDKVFIYKDYNSRVQSIGGEGHILLNRYDVSAIGIDNFGPFYQGYGDVYFNKGRDKGYKYHQVGKDYGIQHLGIGDGGYKIYRSFTPYWIKRLYRQQYASSDYVRLVNFDCEKFEDIATKCSCREACDYSYNLLV